MEITLPNNWNPRAYQFPILKYLDSDKPGKRAMWVVHRRAGKDDVCLHYTAKALHQRVGNYWHLLPKQEHVRKAIWNAINPHTGIRRIDEAFPRALRETTLENEMLIRFKCGSIWQCLGSDNYDSLTGSPPVGIVFSEWAQADPKSWDIVRPILKENGGWAIFITTPRGKNHAFDMYNMARHNPDWFCELLNIDNTGVFTGKDMDEERRSGMSETMIQQEYYCSFEAANEGSYYGKLMEKAEQEGRVCSVPYQPTSQVDTWWDIGIGDETAIWFVQRVGLEVHVIDYHECHGEGMPYYAKVIKDKPYIYGAHWGPHDMESREFGTGKTKKEVAANLGINFQIAPKLSIEDGIEALRGLIPRMWFDAEKCKDGLKALKSYHKEVNERKSDGMNLYFLPHPCHDWSSHAADAARYGAITFRDHLPKPKRERYSQKPHANASYLSR